MNGDSMKLTTPTASMELAEAPTDEGLATSSSMTSSGMVARHWTPPSPEHVTHDPNLYVMNSLTRSKEHFITLDGSKHLSWYMCGPTVYAPSHMGHARTYLSFDILRRILEQYFKYHVTLIMNITDLDDKIIERALEQNITALELSQRYEAEFHVDMAALGVNMPTVVTRVTENVPEIVDYIQVIVDKGLAYESHGSVYFDVQAFENTPNMQYCKLAPEQIHNAALLAEGEGKLTQEFLSDKRSPRDFALWKKSKAHEPTWDSPWGPGRPGWHIECSVMACDILQKLVGNDVMDIHSGGVDLKFPHHDNEMAQAEAHGNCTQWVNYFVHSGHLHIQGLKMSKSLKNFITIQQALEIHSARQIRMLFLMHKYNTSMDYGDNTMVHAIEMEKRFVEFFHNVKAVLRKHDLRCNQKWSPATVALQKTLASCRDQVDAALRDDFDTPTVMCSLVELVKATNVYLEGTTDVIGSVVQNVATYITEIFTVFGLMGMDTIGFAVTQSASRETVLEPVLDALLEFRSTVRDKARSGNSLGVLEECDDFRDSKLPVLGIRLEDKTDGSVWKLADPNELILEMQQRQAEAERKAEEKAKKAEEAAKKEAMNKLSPEEYFKQLSLDDGTLEYSKFDDSGMPTHDGTGEPLSKSQAKKVQKLFKTQQVKYEKHLKSQEPESSP